MLFTEYEGLRESSGMSLEDELLACTLSFGGELRNCLSSPVCSHSAVLVSMVAAFRFCEIGIGMGSVISSFGVVVGKLVFVAMAALISVSCDCSDVDVRTKGSTINHRVSGRAV